MTRPKIGILDHIGVAVRSLDDALAFYRDTLGLEASQPEEVRTEGVRLAFLPVGEGRVELLEPLGPESPVGRFLDKRGEGIHHICLQVENLDETLEELEKRDVRVIPPAPRIGAGGRRVAFVHPSSTGGVLLELKESDGEA